jgi:phosphomannomutase
MTNGQIHNQRFENASLGDCDRAFQVGIRRKEPRVNSSRRSPTAALQIRGRFRNVPGKDSGAAKRLVKRTPLANDLNRLREFAEDERQSAHDLVRRFTRVKEFVQQIDGFAGSAAADRGRDGPRRLSPPSADQRPHVVDLDFRASADKGGELGQLLLEQSEIGAGQLDHQRGRVPTERFPMGAAGCVAQPAHKLGAGKGRTIELQPDLCHELRKSRRLRPGFDIEHQDRFSRRLLQVLFEPFTVLRNKTIGLVDDHEPAIAPHRNREQLVANAFEVCLVAGKPRQSELFLIVLTFTKDLAGEPFEGGPFQVSVLSRKRHGRPGLDRRRRAQKCEDVHAGLTCSRNSVKWLPDYSSRLPDWQLIGLSRMAIEIERKQYICPGETHPISQAVHLARLAALFSACDQCPFRDDARQIAVERADPELAPGAPAPARTPRRDIFLSEGVRGVFLNEVTRARTEVIAAAFATVVWDESPVSGHNDGIDRGARQVRPTVVVGYDERSSSPAIFAGALSGLKRTGCHVIDIGLATKPCLSFAVHHLHASGGLFVTGAGSEPAWTGMDFVRSGARPISIGSGLERIRELVEAPLSRPSRSKGTHRSFQATTPYEDWVRKQFDGVRALKVACASPSVSVRQTVGRLFQSLACEFVQVDIPVRVRDPAHRRDADVLRLSVAVREQSADLGILIDDGERCGFVDERGRHVSASGLSRLLVPLLLAERPGGAVLLEPGAFAEMRPLVEAMGGRCQLSAHTFADVVAKMRETQALYAGGDSGRHWFLEPFPCCDALVVLGKVLNAFSRTNAPFSELAAG